MRSDQEQLCLCIQARDRERERVGDSFQNNNLIDVYKPPKFTGPALGRVMWLAGDPCKETLVFVGVIDRNASVYLGQCCCSRIRTLRL